MLDFAEQEALQALARLPHLASLDVSSHESSEPGIHLDAPTPRVAAMSALVGCHGLMSLNVAHLGVTPEQARNLRKSSGDIAETS